MKRFLKVCAILCLMLVIAGLSTQAQILHPVKWSYGAKKISKTEAIIFLKASIGDGWHIYSAYQKEGGPVPTAFSFAASPGYQLSGKIEEPKPLTRHEESFNMEVSYFEHEVIFRQRVRLKAPRTDVKGNLTFMVCNDHQCLPPETVNFTLQIH